MVLTLTWLSYPNHFLLFRPRIFPLLIPFSNFYPSRKVICPTIVGRLYARLYGRTYAQYPYTKFEKNKDPSRVNFQHLLGRLCDSQQRPLAPCRSVHYSLVHLTAMCLFCNNFSRTKAGLVIFSFATFRVDILHTSLLPLWKIPFQLIHRHTHLIPIRPLGTLRRELA